MTKKTKWAIFLIVMVLVILIVPMIGRESGPDVADSIARMSASVDGLHAELVENMVFVVYEGSDAGAEAEMVTLTVLIEGCELRGVIGVAVTRLENGQPQLRWRGRVDDGEVYWLRETIEIVR